MDDGIYLLRPVRQRKFRMTLRACLEMERGCVEDQPQHARRVPISRKFLACRGWSRTTQPRSGFLKHALSVALSPSIIRRAAEGKMMFDMFTGLPGPSRPH